MSQDRNNQESIHDNQEGEQLADQDLQNITAGICTTCTWASTSSKDYVKAIDQGTVQAPAGVKDAFSSLATKAKSDALQAHEQGVKIWEDCPNCKANGNAFKQLASKVTHPK